MQGKEIERSKLVQTFIQLMASEKSEVFTGNKGPPFDYRPEQLLAVFQENVYLYTFVRNHLSIYLFCIYIYVGDKATNEGIG
mmetsp:Transcript_14823/g.17325  ORF Transcript_14823/g.17325 Transcript_14823/m.17325 type:complete len:82 (-) Transcript_14823:984-1229(-)